MQSIPRWYHRNVEESKRCWDFEKVQQNAFWLLFKGNPKISWRIDVIRLCTVSNLSQRMIFQSAQRGPALLHDLGWPLQGGKHHGCHQEAAQQLPERKNYLDPQLLVSFCRSVCCGEPVMSCVRVWYGSCNEGNRRRLQRVTNAAPALPDGHSYLHLHCCLSRARNITEDSSHHGFHLLDLLPSGSCCRGIRSKTNRLKDNFPKAIIVLQHLCIIHFYLNFLSVIIVCNFCLSCICTPEPLISVSFYLII